MTTRLTPSDFRLFKNPALDRTAEYRANGRDDILSLAAFATAKREISSWPGYRPTPLRRLSGLARSAQVEEIFYKDEAERFGLGSFKALGGAYAVFRLLQQEIFRVQKLTTTSEDLTSGRHAAVTANITVTCATDGNHGRSVAWGARTFGCRCVIYVHETVSEGRCAAIATYGAQVRRVKGTYDDAVRQAALDAASEGWHVVSDTSYPGYIDVPRDVMQGYSLMVEEALAQTPRLPSHVFVQAGVGGLAAGVCAYLWERYGPDRPCFVLVEPSKADCLYRSAIAGRPMPADGALDTIMAGLACGEVSILAWPILHPGTDFFMTIEDAAAAECMRVLADGQDDDAVVSGESGVAGLAGFLLASQDARARQSLGLCHDSSVLAFGTEGATDPEVYRRIVGRSAEQVIQPATEAAG
jgi:diaminopropionate ammonia-lyase